MKEKERKTIAYVIKKREFRLLFSEVPEVSIIICVERNKIETKVDSNIGPNTMNQRLSEKVGSGFRWSVLCSIVCLGLSSHITKHLKKFWKLLSL